VGFEKVVPLSGDPAADGEAIRGWVWTAMRNNFSDLRRKDKRDQRMGRRVSGSGINDAGHNHGDDAYSGRMRWRPQAWDQPSQPWYAAQNPADYVLVKVDWERLERRLPRGSLVLVYRWKVDGESQEALARELGIPQTTLSYRLNRLMHLLRAYFMLEEMDTLPPRANPTDLLARREQMLAALEELWATQPAPRPQPLRRAA
jgi:DNA-directed RNA polymerase specialized sigma24 family protein